MKIFGMACAIVCVSIVFGTRFVQAGEGGAATGDRPNIVIILSDDVGWGDISCYQPTNVFKTPHVDRLAEEGLRLTNAHAPHSVCTPTRYAMLTGRYCWRTFVREGVLPGYSKPLISPRRMTLASLLKGVGYATAAFGKWHIGMGWKAIEGDPGDFHYGSQLHGPGAKASIAAISVRVDHSASITGGPTDVGFDRFFGTPSNRSRIPIFIRDDRVAGTPQRNPSGMIFDPEMRGDTVDDLYVDEAIQFMGEAVDRKEPFFVYLALNAAHGAVDVPEEFRGKSGISDRTDKCLWVNKSVGRIDDALEALKQTNNTLLIYTSDNGPVAKNDLAHGHDASGPWRGFKTDAWDGGSRVPFIARWPGRIKPGTTSDHLFSLVDMMATVASLTGQTLPAWAGEDSFDLLPVLLGEEDAAEREWLITQSYTGILSVRRGKWKLILDTLGSGGFYRYSPEVERMQTMSLWRPDMSDVGQLYDIESDPYETKNVFDEHPKIVDEFKQRLLKSINEGRTRPM